MKCMTLHYEERLEGDVQIAEQVDLIGWQATLTMTQ